MSDPVTVVVPAPRTVTPDELVYQDPDAARVYLFDWRARLGDVTIATSEMLVTGLDDALVKDSHTVLADAQQTTVRLTGGTPGLTYIVTNRITSTGTPPQTDDQSVRLQVVDQVA
jgi:hypothetical protein